MYVYMYVFIKLPVNAQSDPGILFIICYGKLFWGRFASFVVLGSPGGPYVLLAMSIFPALIISLPPSSRSSLLGFPSSERFLCGMRTLCRHLMFFALLTFQRGDRKESADLFYMGTIESCIQSIETGGITQVTGLRVSEWRG